jgi:hypothetical protein
MDIHIEFYVSPSAVYYVVMWFHYLSRQEFSLYAFIIFFKNCD